jgi:uncharacterized protein YdhG (YjbR/CyaY superfamily)
MRNVQKPENVEEYIMNIPDALKQEFLLLREIIKKAAPNAFETMSYGMPCLKGNKVLIHFACFKSHFSIFGYPDSVVLFKDRLIDYHTSKGTIQFPHGIKLPKKLITDIVKYRVQEDQKNAVAKSKKRL